MFSFFFVYSQGGSLTVPSLSHLIQSMTSCWRQWKMLPILELKYDEHKRTSLWCFYLFWPGAHDFMFVCCRTLVLMCVCVMLERPFRRWWSHMRWSLMAKHTKVPSHYTLNYCEHTLVSIPNSPFNVIYLIIKSHTSTSCLQTEKTFSFEITIPTLCFFVFPIFFLLFQH